LCRKTDELIHITALQETRWNGNGWIDKKEYTLLYSGETEKRVSGTALVVLKKRLGQV
jgi:hypothetical protein